MPLLHAIFEVLLRPAEDNDQSAALEKQMLRRSYFAFLQTVTGSGMSEVIANQGRDARHARQGVRLGPCLSQTPELLGEWTRTANW